MNHAEKCSHNNPIKINYMNKVWLLKIVAVLILTSFELLAQDTSYWHAKPTLTFSGFTDVFYIYDLNQPQGDYRQPFLFNHNRHNEFNLNLGLLKLRLENPKYRTNFALQTGTYANDNYASEPGLLKNIFEANIGISLNNNNNLWLDAGILPSHIGFESAISMDNLTLTRSLSAENSPYFLTGAKLSYKPSKKWEIAGLIVNGWQRIKRLEGNSLQSFGTQVNFSPTNKITLNWSTFIGTDDPDTTRRMRYFNNLYGQFQITEKLVLIAGADFGTQQESKGSSVYDVWFSPTVIGQFRINETWKAAIRAEYYQDETAVLIGVYNAVSGTMNGFGTSGLSLNIDYSPAQNIICRVEGRWLNSRDKVFETKTTPTTNNFIIGTSIAIKFSEIITKSQR